MNRLLTLACLAMPALALSAEREPLVLRAYAVEPAVISEAMAPRSLGAGGGEFVQMGLADLTKSLARKTDEDDKQVRKWLENSGVTFPAESYARYMPGYGRLFFYNTEANHQLLKRLLDSVAVTSQQIALDASWISMPIGEIERVARQSASAQVDPQAVLALWKSGTGTLINATRLITKSGVNAMSQGVLEEIYPTEACVGPMVSGLVDRVSTVLPAAFETRETGFIMNYTPTVGPSGHFIDVTIAPEIAVLVGYKDDASPSPGPAVPLPQFHSRNITTSIVLENGKPLLMGGMPTPDGKDLTYLILTATLINARGEPIEDPWKDLASPP